MSDAQISAYADAAYGIAAAEGNIGEVEDELRHLIGVLSKHGGLPRVFDD